VERLPLGIRRVTLPLPTRPGHVHAYLVPGADGWTVVDTGVGLPDATERWAAELAGLDVARVFVTHFHPDHVGAAADVRDLTGAPVLQGALDLEQCRLVWGGGSDTSELVAWFARAGVPEHATAELVEQGAWWQPFIRYADDALPVEPGDDLDGWLVVAAPGHADGQLTLLRDGVLIGADHVLDPITPAVGLWPSSRPDPLGDYLGSLQSVVELAPTIVLPGHGAPIVDPVARARALMEHHRVRLLETRGALGDEPRTAFEVSFPLFGAELPAAARRFAVAETLSHLERLRLEGRAARHELRGVVAYTSA
jgi:glyoxylase-like metal-dependent hydrolase (beta-lactamase superfamily II)